MAIQTLIADDELLARQKLRQLLRGESDIEVVGEASSAHEVYELVRATNPQLMFLDVRMPGMDGLDLISELSMSTTIALPRVILTTAYDHYALRAFELNITDYLLKPFSAERLQSALARAREQIRSGERKSESKLAKEHGPDKYTTRIIFKSRGRILFLPVSDIRWISAEENYVRICTGTETHLLRETMTSMEQRLDPQLFLRVHRSAIVNLKYVKEVRTESRGDFMVHLVNGQKLGMSRTYHSRISELLGRASI
jgi:two-component system, LytTR family, response regulator